MTYNLFNYKAGLDFNNLPAARRALPFASLPEKVPFPKLFKSKLGAPELLIKFEVVVGGIKRLEAELLPTLLLLKLDEDKKDDGEVEEFPLMFNRNDGVEGEFVFCNCCVRLLLSEIMAENKSWGLIPFCCDGWHACCGAATPFFRIELPPERLPPPAEFAGRRF